MDRDSILRIIADVVDEVRQKSGAPCTEDARFADDLNLDSLERFELYMALEEVCGVEIPEGDASNIKTVGRAIDVILEFRKTR